MGSEVRIKSAPLAKINPAAGASVVTITMNVCELLQGDIALRELSLCFLTSARYTSASLPLLATGLSASEEDAAGRRNTQSKHDLASDAIGASFFRRNFKKNFTRLQELLRI